MSFTFSPDADEVVGFVPNNATAAAVLHQQSERFNNMSLIRGEVGIDQALTQYRPDATVFWVDSPLEAMIVREALRSLGHAAEMLFDETLNCPVVVTSRPFRLLS